MTEQLGPIAIDYWDGSADSAAVPTDEACVVDGLQALFATPLPRTAHDRSLQALRNALGTQNASTEIPAPPVNSVPVSRPQSSQSPLSTQRPYQRQMFAVVAAFLLLLLVGVFAVWNGANLPGGEDPEGVIPAAPSIDLSGWPMLRGNSSRDGVTSEAGPTAEPTLLWSLRVGGSTKQSPAVADGILYVGSSNRFLVAIDADTGEELWRFEGDASMEMTPTVANGLVYIPSANGTLYAINAQTGSLRWTFDHLLGAYAMPAVRGSTLYAGSMDGSLYAIDGLTGKTIWTLEVGTPFQRAVAVKDGVAYAGNDDGNLYAVDATTGKVIWRSDTGLSPLGMPTVEGTNVYLVEVGGGLLVLNATTGVYLRTIENAGTGIVGAPAVTGSLVFAGGGINDARIHAYDATTGDEIGVIADPFNEAWIAGPAVANGILYAVNVRGNVIAADPATLQPIWTYDVKVSGNPTIESGPAVAHGVVYVSTDIGMVYALK